MYHMHSYALRVMYTSSGLSTNPLSIESASQKNMNPRPLVTAVIIYVLQPQINLQITVVVA